MLVPQSAWLCDLGKVLTPFESKFPTVICEEIIASYRRDGKVEEVMKLVLRLVAST